MCFSTQKKKSQLNTEENSNAGNEGQKTINHVE